MNTHTQKVKVRENTKEQDSAKGRVKLIREERETRELIPDKTEQVKQSNRKTT